MLDNRAPLLYNGNTIKRGDKTMRAINTIYFDLDGTVADLYGVPNWLDKLRASDPSPYAEAKPLVRLSALARRLNNLQRNGYRLGVISWLSKTGTPEYNAAVEEVKRQWLAQHMPSVNWDEIHIVPYGTPKSTCATACGILFDDENKNRIEWDMNNGGYSVPAEHLMRLLEMLNH